MLGDFFREAAVLIWIFVPMDIAIGLMEEQLSLSQTQAIVILVGAFIGSVLLLIVGIALERWR